MKKIVAIYGSPRRKGNTATLLNQLVEGAREADAHVEEIVLRDLKISPCLEIYKCKEEGECAIKDDFQGLRDKMLAADGLVVASPIFFYTVSAHVKIFMDRCQSLWVRKYWVDKTPFDQKSFHRKGLFLSVGATRGKRLFDGALLTMKYFFDVFDAELYDALLYRGLDFEGDAQKHPDYMAEARNAGKRFAEALKRS
jgi:multimeric flavodoxin WrbA